MIAQRVFLLSLALTPVLPEHGAPQAAPESAGVEAGQVPSDSTFPVPFITPQDRVAAMVREALKAPDREESWGCLDLALSEMNGPTGDGRASVAQGELVSDSLACSGFSSASSSVQNQKPPGGSQGTGRMEGLLAGAWRRFTLLLASWNDLVGREPWLFPGLLVFSALASMWIGRSMTLRTAEAEESSGHATAGPRRLPPDLSEIPGGARNLALALWQGGLPPNEISRRTGLAQDAVSILLMLSDEEETLLRSGNQPQSPPNPYEPRAAKGR